jgi:hypothetical protein
MRRRGRRSKQLLNEVKKKRLCWKLKEEALARTLWRTRYGRGCGPVARQTTQWKDEWMKTDCIVHKCGCRSRNDTWQATLWPSIFYRVWGSHLLCWYITLLWLFSRYICVYMCVYFNWPDDCFYKLKDLVKVFILNQQKEMCWTNRPLYLSLAEHTQCDVSSHKSGTVWCFFVMCTWVPPFLDCLWLFCWLCLQCAAFKAQSTAGWFWKVSCQAEQVQQDTEMYKRNGPSVRHRCSHLLQQMSAADCYLLVSRFFLILALSQNKLIADNVLVFFFYSCTVHIDVIKVFYLRNDAQ